MDSKRKTKLLAPLTYIENETKKRVIVILEHCPLETGRVGDEYKLLSADEHANFLRKFGKPVENYRPDVVHQCLMTLMDSPLNKAGFLEVYLHTTNNTLIKINPQTRIPRTYKRFAGLMVQLLFKLKIRAADENAVLMKVVKNPISSHLPAGCRKICLEYNTKTVTALRDFIPTLIPAEEQKEKEEEDDEEEKAKPNVLNQSVAFIVGGFAHGDVNVDYADQRISISQFPLSASVVCSKITNAFEEHWGIL